MRGWWAWLVEILLLGACMAALASEPFPLETGTYWIYRGPCRWSGGPHGNAIYAGVLSCRMEVTEVLHRDKWTAAVLKGFPTDLDWYTPGQLPGNYLILHRGKRYYLQVSDQATVLKRLRDPQDRLKGLVRDDNLILDFPLKKGKLYGHLDEFVRRMRMWCWQVEDVHSVTLHRRNRAKMPVSHLAYRLAYRTNPDEEIETFVPCIGFTTYTYAHHGTVAECHLRLVTFHRGQAVRSTNSPCIIKQQGVYSVQLPDAMWKALKRYNPTFSIRRQEEFLPSIIRAYRFTATQLPAAVIGDFNGDGKRDVALIGHTNTDDVLLVVCSCGRGYRVFEVEKSPLTNTKTAWYDMGAGKKEYGLFNYLTFAAQGKRESPFEPRMLVIRTAAFQEISFERGAVLYYHRHARFRSYITED